VSYIGAHLWRISSVVNKISVSRSRNLIKELVVDKELGRLAEKRERERERPCKEGAELKMSFVKNSTLRS
jgi:hypothetical protein